MLRRTNLRGSQDRPDPEAQERFLLAAIEHTQNVIVSIESRVPMALVLHGFLFAGLTSVTVLIGPILTNPSWRPLILGLLGLLMLAFVVSVFAFITCISPRFQTPGLDDAHKQEIDQAVSPKLFFVTTAKRRWCWKPIPGLTPRDKMPYFCDFSRAHLAMTHKTVRKILSAELLIVAGFRAY
jgi:hypothetical protein